MPAARDPIVKNVKKVKPKTYRVHTPPPLAPLRVPQGKPSGKIPSPKGKNPLFRSPVENRGPLMRPAASRPKEAWRTRPTRKGQGSGGIGKFLSDAADIASRPLHALAGAQVAAMKGEGNLASGKALVKGLSGKDKKSDFGTVLKTAGVPRGKFRSAASTIGNIAGDPTNLLPPVKGIAALGMVSKLSRSYPEQLAVLKSIARNQRKQVARSPKLGLGKKITADDVNKRTFTHHSGDETGNINFGPDPKRAKVGQLGTGFYAGHGYHGRHTGKDARPKFGTSQAVKFKVKRPLNLNLGMDDDDAREFAVGANRYFKEKYGEPLFKREETIKTANDVHRKARLNLLVQSSRETHALGGPAKGGTGQERKAWDAFLKHMEDTYGFDALIAPQDVARGGAKGGRSVSDTPQIMVNNPKKVGSILPTGRHPSEYDAYMDGYHMGEKGATHVIKGAKKVRPKK